MTKEEEIADIIFKIRQSHVGNETFSQVATKIVESNDFRNGSDGDIKRILIELMYTVFEKTKAICVRTYSTNRWLNTEIIKSSLYEASIPKIEFLIR